MIYIGFVGNCQMVSLCYFLQELLNLCTIKSPTNGRFTSDKGNSYHALKMCEGVNFKNLFVYQIDYEKHISSSVDDLLGHFICFVCFVYYIRKNKNLTKKQIQKHIQYITNDKQGFDKNLFGKTEEERKKSNELVLEKIEMPHHQYILETDKTNQKSMKQFLKKYMVFKTKDIKDIKCNIFSLKPIIEQELNEPLERKNITFKKINKLQKNNTRKNKSSSCIIKKLSPSYYLYSFIKYIQEYLHDDFYGSFSKKEIIHMIS